MVPTASFEESAALAADFGRVVPVLHSLHIETLGRRIVVWTEDRAVGEVLGRVYPALRGGVGTGSPILAVIEVTRPPDRQHQNGYRVTQSGHLVCTPDSAEDAAAAVDCLIGAAVASGVDDYLLIHAGAVETGGGTILFPGPSGIGKSTLVGALSLGGFRCISDDIAALNLETYRFRPVGRAICLKEGGWRNLGGLGIANFDSVVGTRPDGESVRFVVPASQAPPDSESPLRAIVVVNRVDGARARMGNISTSRAMVELLRHSISLRRVGERGVEALAAAVASADCFSLTFCDPGEAVREISRVVGG